VLREPRVRRVFLGRVADDFAGTAAGDPRAAAIGRTP
jgi:hypothetical protein